MPHDATELGMSVLQDTGCFPSKCPYGVQLVQDR